MNMSQKANHRHTQRNVTRLELQGQRQANKLDWFLNKTAVIDFVAGRKRRGAVAIITSSLFWLTAAHTADCLRRYNVEIIPNQRCYRLRAHEDEAGLSRCQVLMAAPVWQ